LPTGEWKARGHSPRSEKAAKFIGEGQGLYNNVSGDQDVPLRGEKAKRGAYRSPEKKDYRKLPSQWEGGGIATEFSREVPLQREKRIPSPGGEKSAGVYLPTEKRGLYSFSSIRRLIVKEGRQPTETFSRKGESVLI